jgi:hypothetical protein
MCEKPATGFEHVPPKSLFPRGGEYRKHLITVPSCDAHNSSKSKDDEYLRHVVVSAPGANEFALKVADEALIPSFERRPHIMKTFLDKVRLVAIGTAETAAFQIDIRRFERAIDAIARGLYFCETGKKLFSETQIIWGALFTPDLSKTPFFDFIRNTEQRTPARYKGSNPEIFRYALDLFHDGREGLCRMQFYEGHPVYVVWDAAHDVEIP